MCGRIMRAYAYATLWRLGLRGIWHRERRRDLLTRDAREGIAGFGGELLPRDAREARG